MKTLKLLFFYIIFCSAVFSGYVIIINGVFVQGWLFLLSSLVFPLKTFKRLILIIECHYFSSILAASSLVASYFFAQSPGEHMSAAFRLLVIVLASMTLFEVILISEVAIKRIYLTITVATGVMVLMALVGVDFGLEVGERFGVPRPFLYANPITIGSMMAFIALYWYKSRNLLQANISVLLMLTFQSVTGVLAYCYYRSKRLTFLVIAFALLLYFVLRLEDIGSVFMRVENFTYTLSLTSLFNWQQVLFGVGIRGLELWDENFGVVIWTNDLTMFLKVLIELGLFGSVALFFITYSIFHIRRNLGAVFLIIMLSIDQIAHLWILPFFFLLFYSRGLIIAGGGR